MRKLRKALPKKAQVDHEEISMAEKNWEGVVLEIREIQRHFDELSKMIVKIFGGNYDNKVQVRKSR